jgi:hypothetical protein
MKGKPLPFYTRPIHAPTAEQVVKGGGLACLQEVIIDHHRWLNIHYVMQVLEQLEYVEDVPYLLFNLIDSANQPRTCQRGSRRLVCKT